MLNAGAAPQSDTMSDVSAPLCQRDLHHRGGRGPLWALVDVNDVLRRARPAQVKV
jgi:hypothetical protein